MKQGTQKTKEKSFYFHQDKGVRACEIQVFSGRCVFLGFDHTLTKTILFYTFSGFWSFCSEL